MENRGLLFIPDISGFTRFVTETEIGHSRLIIQELLEILINSNEIGLEVSEIEGDAILFYKFGDSPDMPTLYKQVERMFCDFHRHLGVYDVRKFCQCKACLSAVDLTLKVITHYGEFTGYNVKNFSKLIGKDVIVAHQLLKNDIDEHEYWLVTPEILHDEAPKELKDWMKWDSGARKTDSGDIVYHYTQLGQLKNEIGPEPELDLDLRSKTKMFSVTAEYDTDIITLFHATGDFNYRHRWMEGVKGAEEVGHFLPRVGMRCRLLLDDGSIMIYSSGYTYSSSRIDFSETDEKRESSTFYILESLGEKKTRLTIEYYIRKNPVKELLFRIGKKSEMKKSLERSLKNIEPLFEEIKVDLP